MNDKDMDQYWKNAEKRAEKQVKEQIAAWISTIQMYIWEQDMYRIHTAQETSESLNVINQWVSLKNLIFRVAYTNTLETLFKEFPNDSDIMKDRKSIIRTFLGSLSVSSKAYPTDAVPNPLYDFAKEVALQTEDFGSEDGKIPTNSGNGTSDLTRRIKLFIENKIPKEAKETPGVVWYDYCVRQVVFLPVSKTAPDPIIPILKGIIVFLTTTLSIAPPRHYNE